MAIVSSCRVRSVSKVAALKQESADRSLSVISFTVTKASVTFAVQCVAFVITDRSFDTKLRSGMSPHDHQA